MEKAKNSPGGTGEQGKKINEHFISRGEGKSGEPGEADGALGNEAIFVIKMYLTLELQKSPSEKTSKRPARSAKRAWLL